MSILPIGGPSRPPPPRRAVVGAAQGFHLPDDAPEAAAPAPSACAVVSLSALISLQDIEPPAERDRRARRQGEDMLAALTKLQRALLCDEVASEALADLSALSARSEMANDPALRDVVLAIRVRAAVELARINVKFCE